MLIVRSIIVIEHVVVHVVRVVYVIEHVVVHVVRVVYVITISHVLIVRFIHIRQSVNNQLTPLLLLSMRLVGEKDNDKLER